MFLAFGCFWLDVFQCCTPSIGAAGHEIAASISMSSCHVLRLDFVVVFA